MNIKEETRIMFSTRGEVEETLITEGTIQEDNMETAKVKMEQVREENERLKLTLSQMMNNYHSLKMQFNGIIQEEDQPKKPTNLAPMAASDDESELVSLSLGRFSGDSRRKEKKNSCIESKNLENDKLDGLELGLDWKSHLGHSTEVISKDLKTENSLDESKEEGNNDLRSFHNKSPKTSRSGDDEILQHNPLKKTRVSIRAVCNTQTMHDGCQWRKYGQKIAKGNPCPRAYYRCTVSSSCPVRKQVQRCIDDMSILITTYEGTHNHPLPPSATTMASATSAAAAMLNCGSSVSPPGHGVSATSSTSPNLFGFNFTSSNNFTTSNFPRATISSSQSHPTVMLDLTPPNHQQMTPSPHNNKFSSTLFSATHSSPTSLNFSSSNASFDLKNTLQIGWESKFPSINNIATPYSQPSLHSNIQASQKQIANDQKIAAATKAITCDPAFQSALAAAITSFVGTNVQGKNSGLNFHLNFSQPSTSNGSIGCGTSFLNKFPQSVNSQQKNLTHFAPLTLSTSKSQAMSLADEGEQIKL